RKDKVELGGVSPPRGWAGFLLLCVALAGVGAASAGFVLGVGRTIVLLALLSLGMACAPAGFLLLLAPSWRVVLQRDALRCDRFGFLPSTRRTSAGIAGVLVVPEAVAAAEDAAPSWFRVGVLLRDGSSVGLLATPSPAEADGMAARAARLLGCGIQRLPPRPPGARVAGDPGPAQPSARLAQAVRRHAARNTHLDA
ncbi:MAG TPA: hypothetical protein VFH47_04470, partial [Candidatus Thermoplasmatota archaeon]|nr:hypothetical protein [Candidatus Thermoplasmatota archaeon]